MLADEVVVGVVAASPYRCQGPLSIRELRQVGPQFYSLVPSVVVVVVVSGRLNCTSFDRCRRGRSSLLELFCPGRSQEATNRVPPGAHESIRALGQQSLRVHHRVEARNRTSASHLFRLDAVHARRHIGTTRDGIEPGEHPQTEWPWRVRRSGSASATGDDRELATDGRKPELESHVPAVSNSSLTWSESVDGGGDQSAAYRVRNHGEKTP